MEIMKITISLDNKEVLSFDILVLIIILIIFLVYKTLVMCFSGRDGKIEKKEDEELEIVENIQEEEEITDNETDHLFEKIATTKIENPMKLIMDDKERREKERQADILRKQKLREEEEKQWMLIKKGKKVKKTK